MIVCIGCNQQFLDGSKLKSFKGMFGDVVYVCVPCLVKREESMR